MFALFVFLSFLFADPPPPAAPARECMCIGIVPDVEKPAYVSRGRGHGRMRSAE